MKANSILELIGNTPVVNLRRIYKTHPNVWIKTEKNNPGGSIKDRIALAMIEDAERSGALQKDGLIIEPTSGNTGIGLAMVGAVKGYKVILVMPESMSVERRQLMEVYGAEFVLTPKEKGMKGAIEKAMEMVAENPKAWSPRQFDNSINVKAHMQTTAMELIEDFPEGIDYLVTGVGTGGHITGVAKVLKEKFPALKVYAVEPAQSPVLSGGEPGPHPLQGIGAGFEPSIYESSLINGVITVEKEEAFNYTKKAALKEGLLGGVSTGASLAAVAKLLPEIPENAKVLSFNYDTGERYLSVEGLF
ncbi:cysteine synthase A [Psychroflexus halocasei]|uniref:Cysteine synthase n=1 Tax=Psychroflexus halocasei TaxID=908615 RepID=A0A1H4CHK5_9FLAO|nr:cysteine synthase A [Psychroflexus halocasei]SEA59542.1 cysteine synthase A [Psychroflexus halocasei]